MNLIDQSIGYSSRFYRDLEKLNAAKLPDSPVALVLKASSREACLADMPKIIQMAKTHRVVLQELNQNHSIGQKVKEATQITGKQPTKLVCFSHADGPSRLEIGVEAPPDSKPKVYFYSLENVKKEDFVGLDKDAQIFLSGCCSGEWGNHSIARKIAMVSRRVVFAPMEVLQRPATSLIEYPDTSWEMFSYLPNGKQHVSKFTPEGFSERPSKENLQDALKGREDIRSSFASSARLMKRYAFEGNAQSQRYMSEFCKIGTPGCPKEHAIHWLLKAAQESGEAQDQYELGVLYDQDPGNSYREVEKLHENAFYWFSLAANQGHVFAQYNVAIYLLNGYGCEKSASRAVRYFQLAADQGLPEALWMMGEYSEHGMGDHPISKQSAIFYYALAAQKGYKVAEAKNKIRVLMRLLEIEGLPQKEVDRMIIEDLQELTKYLKNLNQDLRKLNSLGASGV